MIKYYLNSTNIINELVNPIWDHDVQFDRIGQNLIQKIGTLKFINKDDINIIKGLDLCEVVTIRIEKLCGGTYVNVFEGTFKHIDCKFGQCEMSVDVIENSIANCIIENGKYKKDIYDRTKTVVSYENDNVDVQVCTETFDVVNHPWSLFPQDQTDFDVTQINAGLDPVHLISCNGISYSYLNTPPNTWGLLSNIGVMNSFELIWGNGMTQPGGPIIYPTAYNANYTITTTYHIDTVTGVEPINAAYNGMKLEDVLFAYLSDCGVTDIRSDFFGINPNNSNPINTAYDNSTDYKNVLIFQKSDIKRIDNISGLSTSKAWESKFNDFIGDLQIMNFDWRIEGTTFVLEHVSYFTESQHFETNVCVKEYDYSGNDNVKKETFQYMDEKASLYFEGKNIVYDCGKEDKENILKLLSADFNYISDLDNADNITDKGFFIMANNFTNNVFSRIDENKPFAWTQLHDLFFNWNRLYYSGTINDIQMDFISTNPIVKAEEITITKCCTYVPDGTVKTCIGQGIVQSAIHNLQTSRLKLQLNYDRI